mmetsp:Transcript_6180/g.19803  ORF Transcript_6180/g.19803 Transcript_6180/m.19803 type:complete len:281 (-) Transcript_6180:89-931(-)
MSRSASACGACSCGPWKRASGTVVLHLLVTAAEALALTLSAVLVRAWRVRLLVLLGTLVAQGTAAGALLRAIQREDTPFQAKVGHVSTRMLLWTTATSLPLVWCICSLTVEVIHLVQADADGPPPGRQNFPQFLLVLGLPAWHGALLAATVSRALRIETDPASWFLASRFAEVPEAAHVGDAKCIICLADFEPSDVVLPLPCRHLFHLECLHRWLRNAASCPLRCDGDIPRLLGRAEAEPTSTVGPAREEQQPEWESEHARPANIRLPFTMMLPVFWPQT